MMQNFLKITSLSAAAGVLALLYAAFVTRQIWKIPITNGTVARISGYIAKGARTFLAREYRALLPFVLIAGALLVFVHRGSGRWIALAFVTGAGCSALAGYIGMRTATMANGRVAVAAKDGLNPALRISLSAGSVMGMSVAGLGLIGICGILAACSFLIGNSLEVIRDVNLQVLTGFSFGASSIAIFARVGGGVFTKAADVGADLVGKVEANIPEDDPRNPATIADNVGDNVGDVAGMGADLFESYAGCIIGCMILGSTAAVSGASGNIGLIILPMLLCGAGILASILGLAVSMRKSSVDPQKSINFGCTASSLAMAALSLPIIRFVMGDLTLTDGTSSGAGTISVFLCFLAGIISGMLIGYATEHYTGVDKKPVIEIAKSCQMGTATNIISGLACGMFSTALPVLCIGGAIILTYHLAGLYGTGIAAVGMLSTLGMQLSIDAYGPIADNAGGIAEMAELPSHVRETTDKLDAVGNTTAAIGKGFAIGSAALTALILFNAFKQQAGLAAVDVASPEVVVGLLFGAVVPYIFSSLAIRAVGRAALAMIAEVRRQFRSIAGLVDGKAEADYEQCVAISTNAALKEMIIPGLGSVILPIAVGFIMGPAVLAGLLAGTTVSGVVLAIFMANAGGAWDNAKKLIESDSVESRLSATHAAAVVGDTVGDPLKDTAGPSLNILIKLMMIVALVIAPMLRNAGGV